MRLVIITLIIVFICGLLVDAYIWLALRSYFRRRVFATVHLVVSALMTLLLVAIMVMPVRTGGDDVLRCTMWMLYAYISVYISKYIFVIVDALARLPMLWHRSRSRVCTGVGTVLAVLVFIAMWYGALWGRWHTEVRNVEVPMQGLPESFDGLRIVQISDLHTGTWGDDTAMAERIVNQINALHPDMIVFTGDIVNRHSAELRPFMPVLARLQARYGVYSIMGNHDYGDYEDWPDASAKAADVSNLKAMHRRMGWKMLNNDHAVLRNARGDSLVLVGVENVGDPPFTTYGDLSAAYPTPDDEAAKILLTHNPAHWERDILHHNTQNFSLTLSGHTHAMQVEMFGLSPAVFRYRHWGGLYDEDPAHLLYVNIGIGTVGFPARIGATPEITLLTLRSRQSRPFEHSDK